MSGEADLARAAVVAELIVEDFRRDFTDRRGLRQEWEQIDEDVQAEIIAAWEKLTRARLVRLLSESR